MTDYSGYHPIEHERAAERIMADIAESPRSIIDLTESLGEMTNPSDRARWPIHWPQEIQDRPNLAIGEELLARMAAWDREDAEREKRGATP